MDRKTVLWRLTISALLVTICLSLFTINGHLAVLSRAQRVLDGCLEYGLTAEQCRAVDEEARR